MADHSRALLTNAEQGKRWRWVVLVVARATVGWDAVLGSWGSTVASFVYLVLVGLELFWWSKRRDALLTNADRAAASARQFDADD